MVLLTMEKQLGGSEIHGFHTMQGTDEVPFFFMLKDKLLLVLCMYNLACNGKFFGLLVEESEFWLWMIVFFQN